MPDAGHDPHLAQIHSDELIPDWMEEPPLTWLDEIGLHRELDAAVGQVKRALDERGETCTDTCVRLAIAAWIEKTVRLKLEVARLLTNDGADHFFSILKPTGDADGDSAARLPPPAPSRPAPEQGEQVF